MIAGLNKYIGLPYEQYDCWQFICHYYNQELGILLPTFAGEYRNGADHQNINRIYTRELARQIWPAIEDARWPDLAVFHIDGEDWHAGIVVGAKHMLHIQKGCNSVIEKFTNLRWKNRLYGFYRYQG
jgi:cell wall-associated NlpC family hydrolase